MVSYGWYVFESGASHPTEDEAAAVRFAVHNFPVFTVSWTNLLAPANTSTREDHIVGLNTGRRSYFMKSEIIARSCAP